MTFLDIGRAEHPSAKVSFLTAKRDSGAYNSFGSVHVANTQVERAKRSMARTEKRGHMLQARTMARYRIKEMDGTIRFVEARILSEAIGMANKPYSVTIEGECPANPRHDFVPLTGQESEGKSEFCRVCGLIR